nr:MAG TPA: hypothetical protein [Siphoviridae sp. ctUxW2]
MLGCVRFEIKICMVLGLVRQRWWFMVWNIQTCEIWANVRNCGLFLAYG